MSIYRRIGQPHRVLPAPPPLGRLMSWPVRRTLRPGAPRWVQRQTMRVDIVTSEGVTSSAVTLETDR